MEESKRQAEVAVWERDVEYKLEVGVFEELKNYSWSLRI